VLSSACNFMYRAFTGAKDFDCNRGLFLLWYLLLYGKTTRA
jgi:hypothetical protein